MVNIFLNPLANNKKGALVENLLKDCFDSEEIKIWNVVELKHVTEICKNLSSDDLIVVAGGDGTLHSFVNDIYELHLQQKILYHPCGSGNDFYNDIKDLILSGIVSEECCTRIDGKECVFIHLNPFIQSLPKVFVNGIEKYFINGIGYGLDGYCCEAGDIIRSTSDKKVNYTKIALEGLLGKYKPLNAKVTVDGVTKEYKKVWLSPCMIGRFYGGGMKIAPEQNRLNDRNLLSNVVLHKSGKIRTLFAFPSVFSGKHVKYKSIIDIRNGHKITVSFDNPCALQIDGETVLNVTEYSVQY